jgi:hypothetical protein
MVHDSHAMTDGERFQEIAAILACALLRILVQDSGESSKHSLDVSEDSSLTSGVV